MAADTYTSSLRIQLQGTGNNPDTWGAITNTQFEKFEKAITGDNGYFGGGGGINLTGQTSNVFALTALNGQADQAGQLLYPFIGSIATDFIVLIPGAVKIGWVLNATTGGHNVILKVGSGATLTVPPGGNWTLFYCDSANVTAPTLTFSSGVGSLTVNGTINASGNISAPTFAVSGSANFYMTTNAGLQLINFAPNHFLQFVNGDGFTLNTGGNIRLSGHVLAPDAVIGGSTFASGGATIPGTISANAVGTTGPAQIGGATRSGSYYVNANGQGVFLKDTGAVDRAALTLDGSNCTNLVNAGGLRTRFLNQAGTTEFFGCDNAGNVTFQGNGNVSPTTGGFAGSAYRTNLGWDTNIVGNPTFAHSIGTTAGAFLVGFYFNASGVGSITTNGSATAYNTTSDQTMKLDDGPLTGAGAVARLMRLKPRWFRWKATPDGEAEPGFFAQQVFRVWPWAVTKRHRFTNGKIVRWQMDNSKLVPLLTAALQEAHTMIRAQGKRISALERRVR